MLVGVLHSIVTLGPMSTTPPPSTAFAVIPARGGSKRLPRKNIRLMSGRPLIEWAIDLAIESALFDEVVVSTDDPQIAEIALSVGASVPFERPAELSNDTASTGSVVAHAVSEMQGRGFAGEFVCCIYPASIFVSASDLADARGLLENSDRDYAATLVRYQHPIQRALDMDSEHRVTAVDPLGAARRTQDLEPRWHDAGQFYWGRTRAWLNQIPVLPNAVGYELNASEVQDIDDEVDWDRAQSIHTRVIHARNLNGGPVTHRNS
jgi:pseudaminic acid cytidylyltransferase